MKRNLMKNIMIFILIFFCGTQAVKAIDEQFPLKPPDTSSPRSTMRVFMETMHKAFQRQIIEGYSDEKVSKLIDHAAQCLDLSQIPPTAVENVADETALLLKEVLDRIPIPPYKAIPDKNEINFSGLRSWKVPNTDITIAKIEEGPRQGEFLFSTNTVAKISEFYERVEHLPYKSGASVDAYEDYIFGPGPLIPRQLIRSLPSWAKIGVYDQAIWQWIGFLISFIISGIMLILVFRWTRPKITDADETAERWSWRSLVFPLAWMIIVRLLEYFLDMQINITGIVFHISKIVLRSMLFIAVGWGIIVIGNGIAEAIIASKRVRFDPNLIRLLSRLITLILLCVLLWNASDYLGLTLTAVFASAGIVGLGVALAARETLANLFGGVSIFLDRPFKTGDYIVLDSGERGMVVDVGLRSTRILTRDDVQISIPNSIITNEKIINESAPRPRFRVRIKIGVAYDSDVDQVERILISVTKENNLVSLMPEPRVRFRKFGDSALEFELLCWANRPEDKGRLIHGLNHQIYNAFAATGIQIPFPQRDVHLHTDSQDSKTSD